MKYISSNKDRALEPTVSPNKLPIDDRRSVIPNNRFLILGYVVSSPKYTCMMDTFLSFLEINRNGAKNFDS